MIFDATSKKSKELQRKNVSGVYLFLIAILAFIYLVSPLNAATPNAAVTLSNMKDSKIYDGVLFFINKDSQLVKLSKEGAVLWAQQLTNERWSIDAIKFDKIFIVIKYFHFFFE